MKKFIIALILTSGVFLTGCVTKLKLVPIENTVYVTDTIHDTLVVDRPVYLGKHDTIREYVFVPKYIETTVYVPKVVKDTVIFKDPKLLATIQTLENSIKSLTSQINTLKSKNTTITISKDLLSVKVKSLEDLLLKANGKSNTILWWLLGVLALAISVVLYIKNRNK